MLGANPLKCRQTISLYSRLHGHSAGVNTVRLLPAHLSYTASSNAPAGGAPPL